MKYGVVSYHDRPMQLSGRDSINIGDIIQTIAMLEIYKKMGIEENDIVQISRYYAKEYSGENVFLPFNCYNEIFNQKYKMAKTFPISEKITPLYFSFHLHTRVFSKEIEESIKKYEPVGCRDEETLQNMKKHGIDAYLSGCVTALFELREKEPLKEKYIFVDTPTSLEPYIPEEVRKKSEYLSHAYPLLRTEGEPIMSDEEYEEVYLFTKKRLLYYKENATVIVTSRLHAAAPCMAMGIPVILVSDNFDGRFSWIDKYLKLYTPDAYISIDWKPRAIQYEAEKNKIRNIVINEIRNFGNDYSQLASIGNYYENRPRTVYNKGLISELKRLESEIGENIAFAIWGIINNASNFLHMIQDYFPTWKYLYAVDKVCEGEFEGIQIDKPDKTDEYSKNIVYFIMPPSAHSEVAEYLREKRKPYVLVNKDRIVDWELFDFTKK